MVIPPAPFVKQCVNPNIVISSFLPATTQLCESGQGIADTWSNKLQGKECVSCNEIYEDAEERKEAGKGEQAYDVHVARSICSDDQLEGDNKYWQTNVIILVATMISIIVLCTVYEVFKNKEIANQRKIDVEIQTGRRKSVQEEGDEAPDTERQLMKTPDTDKTDQSIDTGAKKASRVKAGDQSVMQDDEDFSDSEDVTINASSK